MRNQLISSLMTALSSMIAPDDMKKAEEVCTSVMSSYHVEKTGTELAVYEPIPQAFKDYITTRHIEGLSKNTLKTYSLVLMRFFRMTNLPIQQIDPVAVKMWVFNLKKTNITGRTLASYQRIVKTFFRWCSDNGYLEKNPCRSVAMVKYEMRRRHALSRDELTSIRYACADLRERTMVELLYSTGCRVSELVSIRKQDIDMDKGIVYAKNWKSRREKIVYISDVCKFYLNKYLPTVSDNGDFLFYNKNRSSGTYTPIKVRGVERMVSSIGSRASLPKGRVHPHIFRHTLATDIVGGGGSLADAQRVLDHSKIETTLIYAEMSNSHIQEVHKRCIS